LRDVGILYSRAIILRTIDVSGARFGRKDLGLSRANRGTNKQNPGPQILNSYEIIKIKIKNKKLKCMFGTAIQPFY
jgi:hypothetical protein